MWHLTPDTCHMVGGEHSLKISAPLLLQFGFNDVLTVWRKMVTDWLNESISDKGDCRIVPATTSLLNRVGKNGFKDSNQM